MSIPRLKQRVEFYRRIRERAEPTISHRRGRDAVVAAMLKREVKR